MSRGKIRFFANNFPHSTFAIEDCFVDLRGKILYNGWEDNAAKGGGMIWIYLT